MSDDYKLRADLQAIIDRAGDQPHWHTATDKLAGAYTSADMEATVRRALEAALVRLILNLWRHEGGDAYSQGMDAGARHQHEQDVKVIRAIGADPEALRRIVEGGE